VQKNEGVDCAIGGRTGTFCKDRAGHALLSDCSTNERSAFIAVPLPFRGYEDRIGGSAIWAHVSNQGHQIRPRGASDWWRYSVRKSVSVHQDKILGSAILLPLTSMATPERATMAIGCGAFGMCKCWVDSLHWFAPTTPAGRVVDARTTRRVDFYCHILLWPPENALEWPVHAARLGCINILGTTETSLQPLRALVASWTHALRGV